MELSIAAFAVTIAAWSTALVIGRVSAPMQRVLVGVLHSSANNAASTCLLIDRWPVARLAPAVADPVTLAVDHVALNRAAVLFRVVISFPAVMSSQVLSPGGRVSVIGMWFSMLGTGIIPVPVHRARCLVLRFAGRTGAYAHLLPSTQPFDGIFGDEMIGLPAPSAAPPLSA
jgi:hypothetical protein